MSIRLMIELSADSPEIEAQLYDELNRMLDDLPAPDDIIQPWFVAALDDVVGSYWFVTNIDAWRH